MGVTFDTPVPWYQVMQGSWWRLHKRFEVRRGSRFVHYEHPKLMELVADKLTKKEAIALIKLME